MESSQNTALFVAGISGALTNTLLVMNMIYFFFKDDYAQVNQVVGGCGIWFIMTIIGINGVPECNCRRNLNDGDRTYFVKIERKITLKNIRRIVFMILAIDIGNTNLTIGCFEGEQIYFAERLSTDLTRTDLEYAVSIKTILELYGIKENRIRGGIISSVVPPLTKVIAQAAKKVIHRQIKVVGPE